MSEIQNEWNKAILQVVIDEIEFMVNAANLMVDFVVHQHQEVKSFQEHIWEIL